MTVGFSYRVKQSCLSVSSVGVILWFFNAQFTDWEAGKYSSFAFFSTQILEIKLNQLCIVIKIHFHQYMSFWQIISSPFQIFKHFLKMY